MLMKDIKYNIFKELQKDRNAFKKTVMHGLV